MCIVGASGLWCVVGVPRGRCVCGVSGHVGYVMCWVWGTSGM